MAGENRGRHDDHLATDCNDVRRDPGRSTLTLLSIAIGIALVIAASLATATTRHAYRRMYEEIAGLAALQVTAPAKERFLRVHGEIVQLLGVQAAVPSYQRATRISFDQKHLALIAIGSIRSRFRRTRYELREGRLLTPDDRDSGLLEVGFAKGAGIHVGDRVKFLSAKVRSLGHLGTITIVGLLAPRGPADSTKAAQCLFRCILPSVTSATRGRSTLLTSWADAADENAVGQKIREILPSGLEVHPPPPPPNWPKAP